MAEFPRGGSLVFFHAKPNIEDLVVWVCSSHPLAFGVERTKCKDTWLLAGDTQQRPEPAAFRNDRQFLGMPQGGHEGRGKRTLKENK